MLVTVASSERQIDSLVIHKKQGQVYTATILLLYNVGNTSGMQKYQGLRSLSVKL